MGARCFKSANDGSISDIYIPDREDTGYITEQGNQEVAEFAAAGEEHVDPSSNEVIQMP